MTLTYLCPKDPASELLPVVTLARYFHYCPVCGSLFDFVFFAASRGLTFSWGIWLSIEVLGDEDMELE